MVKLNLSMYSGCLKSRHSKNGVVQNTDANLPIGCVINVQNPDAKLHHATSSTAKLDHLYKSYSNLKYVISKTAKLGAKFGFQTHCTICRHIKHGTKKWN